MALHLPRHGVLFTGGAVAASPVGGSVLPGLFDADRAQAVASFRWLAALEGEVACLGHGDPVIGGASRALRSSADACGSERR